MGIARGLSAIGAVVLGFHIGMAVPIAAGEEGGKTDLKAWGEELFMTQCASCHGKDGKGDGPAAEALSKPPKDLTRIAERNEGTFPRVTVEEIIDGQRFLMAHGSREMPIWGDNFSREKNVHEAAMRVSALTEYLESIQAK